MWAGCSQWFSFKNQPSLKRSILNQIIYSLITCKHFIWLANTLLEYFPPPTKENTLFINRLASDIHSTVEWMHIQIDTWIFLNFIHLKCKGHRFDLHCKTGSKVTLVYQVKSIYKIYFFKTQLKTLQALHNNLKHKNYTTEFIDIYGRDFSEEMKQAYFYNLELAVTYSYRNT